MKSFSSFTIAVIISLSINAQSQKKVLDHTVYDDWNKLSKPQLSEKGNFISYEIIPGKGDGKLILNDNNSQAKDTFPRGYKAVISANETLFAYHIKPTYDTLRKCKLEGFKKEKFPKDSLGIYSITGDSISYFPNLISFKLPEKNTDWIAFLNETKIQRDTSNTDSIKSKKKKKKTQILNLFSFEENHHFKFKNVEEYTFSEDGFSVAFIINKNDSIDSTYVHHFDLSKQIDQVLFKSKGQAKKITINKTGDQIAFLHSTDTINEKAFQLNLWNSKSGNRIILDTNDVVLPKTYSASINRDLFFSDDSKKLYFGIAPTPKKEEKDSIPDDEKPVLDLWSWTDDRIQPQQKVHLKDEKKKTFLSCYHIKDNKFIQIQDSAIDRFKLFEKGNKNFALGISLKPYYKRITWTVPSYKDFYIIDIKTGNKKLIIREKNSSYSMSPNGKYFVFYEIADSNWYAIDIAKGSKVNLTEKLNVNFWDEKNDEPTDPYPYKIGGWLENDKYVLLQDRFDIWKIDPSGKTRPINLSQSFGRDNNTRLSIIAKVKDLEYFKEDTTILLKGFNELTKDEFIYSFPLKSSNTPKKLYQSSHMHSRFLRKKDTDKIIFRKQSFHDYPEVFLTDIKFNNPTQITLTNPQQEDYLWGNVTMIEWMNLNAKKNKGLLYTPENFDSTKQYPLLVYFYDKHTDELHEYTPPTPHRSIIRPAFYTSRGYIVFMPDIKYKAGYPGESCFNAVISGVNHLIALGNVDANKIGVQGTSWGGYQISYLITRTDIFKAAMAGSPVSNMISAYGGIRWKSGLSRAFQYEVGQSRIGKTLWDKPMLYIENSPIFYVDKINTPLLIRHDDKDGAVPWYQGIELFMGMRRLNKPVWMLNYNDEPHNLTKRPNMIDFAIRMQQFFDHYLKDEPMPKWMKEGIPAIKKGKELGYELEEN